MSASADAGTEGTHGFDLERELIAAMSDYADGAAAPVYDPRQFLPVARPRHSRRMWALAAAVVTAAALGAGLTALPGHSGRAVPPSAPRPLPSVSTRAHSGAPSPRSTTPTSTLPMPQQQMDAVRTLVVAAEMSEDPATRGGVDLAAVQALFTDHAAFAAAWGSNGLGVTCGVAADGGLSQLGTQVQYFAGTTALPGQMTPEFASGAVLQGVSCADVQGGSGDPTVSGYYGSLVAGTAGGASLLAPGVDAATAGCGRTTARSWYADNPAAGTVGEGWTMRLDGGRAFTVSIDGTPRITGTDCTGTAD
jgi:hypothetical protein